MDKRSTLPQECLNCQYYTLCRGECPKHRFEPVSSGEGKRNTLCEGFKQFFKHTEPYMKYMRDLLVAGRPAFDVIPWARTNF
ncbi:MAG: SPASM domain-containing protein, partial [Bacteroidales bacterium]|nr:SPASM domain-containing protein [Bacteroidales bacterium]